MTTNNAQATKSPKTLAEKLVDAEAYVAKLKARIAAEALINNVDVDDNVSFNYGRAERKRELSGTVVAKKQSDTGLQLKIQVGEDFDAEFYTVFARDLTANATKGTTIAPLDDEEPTLAAQ